MIMKIKTVRNKIFMAMVEVEKICGYDVAKNFLKDNTSGTIELEQRKAYKVIQITTRYEKGYYKRIIVLREFKFDHETNDFIIDILSLNKGVKSKMLYEGDKRYA